MHSDVSGGSDDDINTLMNQYFDANNVSNNNENGGTKGKTPIFSEEKLAFTANVASSLLGVLV